MNRLCALPLVWGVALLAGPPREIAGRVVDAQTGAPIPHARVRITGSGSQTDEIVLLTGVDGAFDLTGVPEGQYQLSCEQAGYLRGVQNVASQPVPAASDAKAVPVAIRLTPQAVIEGAVVDENGGAAPFANIQVYRRVAIEGRRQAQFVQQAQADDNGAFRIFGLAAGGYCIGATISPAAMRRRKLAYPPVFYPNSPGTANAQFVELRPGQQQQIRIRLPEPVPAREIRGQIVPAVQGVSAQLRPADSAVVGSPSGFEQQWDQKTHSFKFTGVTPGVYVIDVTAQLDGQQRRATRIVTVAGQDIAGIRLELSTQTRLTGTVRVEGRALRSIRPQTSRCIRLHTNSARVSRQMAASSSKICPRILTASESLRTARRTCDLPGKAAGTCCARA
jgi:carboxypeptidase family protein